MPAPVLTATPLAAPALLLRASTSGAPALGLADDLSRARAALDEARYVLGADDRFHAGHLVALRVAAVVLAMTSRPAGSRRLRNAWEAVAETAPALAGWASFFAATEEARDAVRDGERGVVDATTADEVVRAAGQFLDLVDRALSRGSRAASGRTPR